ncbi:hypothetical protein [Streptomyces sp. WMMB303]|uniref:deazapurine DNA modification protein DpdA family protein n=1 Tax=Streptomyces sp. WMMB303 TaxID=3034154 RepID=UPI0023EBD6F5|nr:hypothetical protein [Streptomyces sp. WMMB303]MDF4254640.1 hypothetical protein [Streptomyces sp. WMMB303]
MTRFYLGAPPTFMKYTDVPLFISNRPLVKLKTLHQAHGPVAVDSGGFSELDEHGSWDHGPTPRQYASQVRRYAEEIGIEWAAPQDWMCEPWITAKTGLTVAEHQARTIGSYLDLKALDDTLPIIPVLQGWTPGQYEQHIDAYDRAGIDLRTLPLVGIGSVCRRQGTEDAASLVERIAGHGIRLHGFGFKIDGLRRVSHHMPSADSMAWAAAGRRTPAPNCDFRFPGSRGPHLNEANCLRFALAWRQKVIAAIEESKTAPRQLSFLDC